MTREGLEVGIIVSLIEKNETARAIRMAETYLQKHPGNREAALLLAKAYKENDQIKETIRIFEQIVEAEPDDVEVRLELAELYSRIDLWENAKQALRPALEFPGHQLASMVRCAYGSYLYRTGERDKGSDLMWLEVKNSPDNIQILHRAALTLFAGGETKRLEEILVHLKEETGQLTPLAFFLLGQCYYADAKWQEALDALDSASHLSRSPLGLGMIGDCAFELGRYTRARQAYAELLRAAQDLDPRQVAAAHFRLAYIEWRRGMHERALPHLVRAHEARPDDPDTLWLLAEIYLQRRETDRAMAITVNLHRVCPDHPGLNLLIPRLFPHLVRRERRKPLYGASRPWRRFRCRARPRTAEAT
jgi:tetratricopeptide (TPR) repeat protein